MRAFFRGHTIIPSGPISGGNHGALPCMCVQSMHTASMLKATGWRAPIVSQSGMALTVPSDGWSLCSGYNRPFETARAPAMASPLPIRNKRTLAWSTTFRMKCALARTTPENFPLLQTRTSGGSHLPIVSSFQHGGAKNEDDFSTCRASVSATSYIASPDLRCPFMRDLSCTGTTSSPCKNEAAKCKERGTFSFSYLARPRRAQVPSKLWPLSYCAGATVSRNCRHSLTAYAGSRFAQRRRRARHPSVSRTLNSSATLR